MHTVTVGLLGPLDLRVGAQQIRVGGNRQRTILAMLAMTPGRVVSMDRLIEAVWSDAPPATARTQIAICVVSLRKAFEEHDVERAVLATASPGYQLQVEPDQVDVTRFVEAMGTAAELAKRGDTTAAVDRVTQALALWRGPAMTGLSCHDLELEASRLDEQRLTAVELRAGWCLELGRHSEVVNELSAVVVQQPLRELARAHLMLALYRAGLRTEALATYRDGRRISVEEFGIEPGPLTRRMHDAILGDDPHLTLAEPALDVSSVVPAQLPAESTGFLGRRAELLAMDGLLVQPGAARDGPLIAYLTGARGTGKTALAVHWARGVAHEYPDGQLYVDLGDATADPLGTCLRSLGVAAEDVPTRYGEQQSLYRSILSGRRAILLLDDARSAEQVDQLLPGSAGCCVVVTSREVLYGLLGRYGAVHLPVGVLIEPDAVELLGMLVGRDRIAADLPAAGRLARLCDLLPLALRIIGARLAARPGWSVRDLAVRMADESRRLDELRTVDHDMRALMAETCAALTESEAVLLRRIGGLAEPLVSLPTCAALLDTTAAGAETTMDRLVDRALAESVLTGTGPTPRYRVSGLLHSYAGELCERLETGPSLLAMRLRVDDAAPVG
jgi:DNA-binding SARP family transcriptional activator